MKKVNRSGRRALVAGSAVAAATLLLAACSGASTSGSAGSAGSTGSTGSTGSASANAGGTLVFGISADPTQMIPWTTTAEQSVQVLSQIYSTLLNTDSNGNLVPGLSGLPVVGDGGDTYTFTLKSGVKFTGGASLTSADVKYTFDLIMNPSSDASGASFFESVASVAAPNPTTVVVHMKHPDASFPSGLTGVNTAIVPSDVPVASLTAKPDGSGPYQFVSRTPNESITLKRNPDYYGGKPGVAKLELRIIPNDQSMVSALKTGDRKSVV